MSYRKQIREKIKDIYEKVNEFSISKGMTPEGRRSEKKKTVPNLVKLVVFHHHGKVPKLRSRKGRDKMAKINIHKAWCGD